MIRCCLVAMAVVVSLGGEARAAGPCDAEAAATRGKRDPSLTPPTEPEAVRRMKAGNAHHVEGIKRASVVATREQAAAEFKAAIDEYVAAAMISPSPSILFNLAQTYRAAGDYPSAIEQYRLFLDRAKPGKALRALVECHIAAMSAELARAAATAPPRGPAPDPDDEPPASGTPPVERPAPPDGAAARAERPTPLAGPPWHADALGWSVSATGVAVVGLGAFLLVDAASLREQANDETRDDVRHDLDARADRRKTWGTVTTVAGVAALAAGVVKLAIVPDRAGRSGTGVSVRLAPGGLALGGSF